MYVCHKLEDVPMRILKQSFSVNYHYDVYFTKNLFEKDNPVFSEVIKKQAGGPAKILVIIDEKIAESHSKLCDQITDYIDGHSDTMQLCEKPLQVPGGESIKNSSELVKLIYQHINVDGICRHSYVVAIGGGAFLDTIGFAAATAHRGIRLIRVPTTVLAQDDSGVGVKNGVNYFGKKNYIGTFAPPFAVLNDFNFLKSLELRDWISGLAEAVKVALIKDAKLFHYIRSNAAKVREKNEEAMEEIICRSAELHMLHIGTQGDPFELGSSRPLDFGHWAAHKLEQVTKHRLRHGEAVAIGVALDSTYSYLTGLLPKKDWQEILKVLHDDLGLTLYVPELSLKSDNPNHPDSIFKGLIEFREHLGGELTIMMLGKIGKGIEIHSVDFEIYGKAIDTLRDLFSEPK
jgi:3-dehydroquinate synthase